MSRKAVIVIPAFDPPPERLEELLIALYEISPEQKILLFNDGSNKNIHSFLESLPGKYPHLILLSREENRGKGSALKECFSHILHNYPSSPIVTADSDGQHLAEDILHIVSLMEEGKEELILGVRDFSSPGTPLRSKWGNLLTGTLFALLTGVKLLDTQTGLRGISSSLAAHLLETCRGDHYEFEMEILREAVKQKIPIREEKIATIYRNSNKESHFRVFADSFRIWRKLLSRRGKK